MSRDAPRRLVGTLLLAGLVLVSLALVGLTVAPAPATAAGRGHGGGGGGGGVTTCPAGGRTIPAPGGGSVTAYQTTELVNQVVHVCWQGFKPSSDVLLRPTTFYPVRVYQCRAQPTGPGDCYGSSLFGPGGSIPDGPTNHLDAVTSPQGVGSVDIEVRTKIESSTLGCSSTKPCSLVVVPNKGDPAQPDLDYLYATISNMDSPFAWAQHVTIPISFQPTGADCPIRDADVTSIGAAMTERAVTRWQPATCTGAAATIVDYTALGEEQARNVFLGGQSDVAFTMLPAAADPPPRPFTYAPVSADGIAVAFRVDDPVTGQPITSMRLTARLIAKLVTESYSHSGYVAPGQPVGPGNPATVGNPRSLFDDPEFLALQAPGVNWPIGGGSTPLLLSDNSDMTSELTRWLASDSDARAFLAGTPDPQGMHVNTAFRGVTYPASSFESRDSYPAFTYQFAPVKGLDTVARYLVNNQPPGVNATANADGTHPRSAILPAGQRDLVAIIDSANAKAFAFPTAQLKNPSGAWTSPDGPGLAAGVAAMKPDASGLLHADYATTSPTAYPVTAVQYAMAPTAGLSTDKAEKVARLLDYASGPGQVSGVSAGQLPAGYLPLPQTLLDKTKAAAAAVRAQAGAPPSPSPSASPSAGPPPAPVAAPPVPAGDPGGPAAGGDSGGGAGAGSGVGSGAGSGSGSGAAPSFDPAVPAQPPAAAPTPAPTSAAVALRAAGPTPAAASGPVSPGVGSARWVLLAVLIAGLAAALLGPGTLLLAGHRETVAKLLRQLVPTRWRR